LLDLVDGKSLDEFVGKSWLQDLHYYWSSLNT
jgi:hypothetical protein